MLRDTWILVTGLISIVFGLRGLYPVANPRHDREREVRNPMIACSIMTVGGGLALAGYSLFA